jgi:aminoglycoside/choline kinase family phosphotransferase
MTHDLVRLAADRGTILESLATLPQTLCHRDVFPRNAFLRHTKSGAQTVAIDWAFCGPGPIGGDLVPLVEASLTWFEADQADAPELEDDALPAIWLDSRRSAGRATHSTCASATSPRWCFDVRSVPGTDRDHHAEPESALLA